MKPIFRNSLGRLYIPLPGGGDQVLAPPRCAALERRTGIRSISRAHDVSPNTAHKLLRDAGRACFGIHDQEIRAVKAERIQTYEIWSFCYAKHRNVATAEAAPLKAGDV